jgi:hypothetical protein
MDHGAIARDRQVEAVPIERHELRAQLSDLADEGGYQLLFGPVADVGRSEGLDRPVVIPAPGQQGADARSNGRCASETRRRWPRGPLRPSSPASPFAAAKPRRSGTVSRSQTMTLPFMA